MSSTTTVRMTSAGQKVRIVQSASPVPSSGGGGGGTPGVGGKVAHTHRQTTASATWMVAHDLGRQPSVTILDQDGRVVLADIQHLSAAVVSIGFSAPMTGTALLT